MPEAQYTLGILYIDNKYIQRDTDRSIYYLSLAANQNFSKAQLALGKIYSIEMFFKIWY